MHQSQLLNSVQLCRNLKTLCLHTAEIFDYSYLLPALATLSSLKELVVNFNRLFPWKEREGSPYDLSNPVFKRLTHLSVLGTFESWGEFRELRLLTNLTHFGIFVPPDDDKGQGLQRILEDCEWLRVVVVRWQGFRDLLTCCSDPRVVSDEGTVIGVDFVRDWLREVDGFGGFWGRAEDLIKSRVQTAQNQIRRPDV